MKKLYKYIVVISFSILMFFTNTLIANAKSGYDINSINIEVDIRNDGSAKIKEIWDVNISPSTNSTEWYLNKDNLSGSKITNLRVVENGKTFSPVDGEWNINLSRASKAFKSGIKPNKSGKGVELCWGIGEYGKHIFEVTYDITELVDGYSDKDGFNWRFVNDRMVSVPKEVNLTIRAPFNINKDNSRIWLYGNTGNIEFKKDSKNKGIIFATAKNKNYSSFKNNFTVVAAFNKGLLKPSNNENGTMQKVIDFAKKGSSFENNRNNSIKSFSRNFFHYIDMIISFSFSFIFFVIALISFGNRKKTKIRLSKREKNNLMYSRDLPYNGNIFASNVALSYVNEYKKSNIVSAIILKWVNEGYVILKETEAKRFLGLGTKKVNSLIFYVEDLPDDTVDCEVDLFNYLLSAADGDDVLQEAEIRSYVLDNKDEYMDIMDALYAQGELYLEENNIIYKSPRKGLDRLFGKEKIYKINSDMKDKIIDVLRFKKYLVDFTIINEREVKEVQLWDKYLMFAALYGIADKVYDQLKELNPKYIEYIENQYGDYNDLASTIIIANSLSNSAYMSSNFSTPSSSSSSFGGGGGGSFGGGGGFSGGGSGGGGR